MGECSVCGKKLGMFQGYETSDKEFCEDCWNKREIKEEKKEEVKEEKQEQKKEIKKDNKNVGRISLGLIVFVILIIILSNSSNEEYKDCVKDCKDEYDYCISISTEYSPYGNEYILSEDSDYCSYDLDDCIDDCER